MAEWQDGFGALDPEQMVAISKYELIVGGKITDRGANPFIAMKLTGHPHLPDGTIDLGATMSTMVIFQTEDAAEFARDIHEATKQRP